MIVSDQCIWNEVAFHINTEGLVIFQEIKMVGAAMWAKGPA